MPGIRVIHRAARLRYRGTCGSRRRGYPLAGPCQVCEQKPRLSVAIDFQMPVMRSTDAMVESLPKPQPHQLQPPNRARFFKLWLRRIAPDTHQDQASGVETTCHPGGIAAPEERWCRNASNGFITTLWLTISGCQSIVGSRYGRSVLLQIGDGDSASYSTLVADPPIHRLGLQAAVVAHAKQRAISNGLCSFRM